MRLELKPSKVWTSIDSDGVRSDERMREPGQKSPHPMTLCGFTLRRVLDSRRACGAAATRRCSIHDEAPNSGKREMGSILVTIQPPLLFFALEKMCMTSVAFSLSVQ
eukprot:scaffold336_cov196-Amphora_coffeaeformis.AAC.4